MATAPLAPTPLQVLHTRLAAYYAAEAQILEAQAYQVGDGATARNLQRARLDEVQRGIMQVRSEIAAMTPGRRRVLYLR